MSEESDQPEEPKDPTKDYVQFQNILSATVDACTAALRAAGREDLARDLASQTSASLHKQHRLALHVQYLLEAPRRGETEIELLTQANERLSQSNRQLQQQLRSQEDGADLPVTPVVNPRSAKLDIR